METNRQEALVVVHDHLCFPMFCPNPQCDLQGEEQYIEAEVDDDSGELVPGFPECLACGATLEVRK